MERLDKLVANQFNITRSEARAAIRRGRVTVDGAVVRIADHKASGEANSICLDGNAMNYRKFMYIVMNKPAGVLSASKDKNSETVIDLIPNDIKRRGLFCVGRLDKNTTGLLLITDDGDFSHKLMAPDKEIYKTYIAELDGDIPPNLSDAFLMGVTLADGTVCRPAKLTKIGERTAELKICEGRYHQVKRMFGVYSLGVNSLKRVAIGGFFLPEELAEGEARELTVDELKILKNL